MYYFLQDTGVKDQKVGGGRIVHFRSQGFWVPCFLLGGAAYDERCLSFVISRDVISITNHFWSCVPPTYVMYTCANRSNPDVAVVSSTDAPHSIACFSPVRVSVLKRVVYFCTRVLSARFVSG